MKVKYLDDMLCVVVEGEKSDLKDCARIMIEVTNGGITGYRNENILENILGGKPYVLGHHNREIVKIFDGRVIYKFMSEGASEDAKDAAKNHYGVIKENIQAVMEENDHIKRRYG